MGSPSTALEVPPGPRIEQDLAELFRMQVVPSLTSGTIHPASLKTRGASQEKPLEARDGWAGSHDAPSVRTCAPQARDLSSPPTLAHQGNSPAPAHQAIQLGSYPSVFFAPGGKTEIPAELSDLLEKRDPPALGGIPSRRWVVTPKVEASHLDQVNHWPLRDLLDRPDSELKTLIGPVLNRRYGQGEGQTVLELGPATSTTVAETLPQARYLAVDLSGPYLSEQHELLQGRVAMHDYQAMGDSYCLPVQQGSCSVVVTSCHPPFVSASPEDKKAVIDEVARALEPGGEFLLFPYSRESQPPEVTEHLLKRFDLVDEVTGNPSRTLLVLKRRPD